MSFEDAVEAGREALSGHLAMRTAEGSAPPSPRTLTELRADHSVASDLKEAIVQLITPRRIAGERVRIGITIDRDLLRLADEAAEARGLSRSAFIAAALASAAET